MFRHWKNRISIVALAAVLGAVLSFSTAPASAAFLPRGIPSGNGVTPTVVDGFAHCSTGTEYTWSGSALGTQSPEEGVSITLSQSVGSSRALPGGSSRYVDFTISGAAMAEVVMFTNFLFPGYIFDESNVYSYNPADAVSNDTRLHPPALLWNVPLGRDGMRFCYEPAGADLSIDKSVDVSDPDGGDTVTYTLVVSNGPTGEAADAVVGGTTATGVSVIDTLPPGLSVVSTDGGVEGEDGTITWSDLVIEPGTSVELTVVATVDEGAIGGEELVNSAEVIPGAEPDPNLENNTSSASITPNEQVDVSIVKTVDDDVVSQGDTVVYTLAVANSEGSNATATDVQVVDSLPDHVSVTSISTEACFESEGGAIICSLGDLDPGDSTEITIEVSVHSEIDVPSAGLVLTNTASVNAEQSDPDPENNESSVDISVQGVLTCDDVLQSLDAGEIFTGIEMQIFGNFELGDCSDKNIQAQVIEDEGGEQFFVAFDGAGVAATKIVVEKDFPGLGFTPLRYAPVDTFPSPGDYVDVPWCNIRPKDAGDGDQFVSEIGTSLYPTLAGVTDPGTGAASISCKVDENQSVLGLQTTVVYGEFADPWYR